MSTWGLAAAIFGAILVAALGSCGGSPALEPPPQPAPVQTDSVSVRPVEADTAPAADSLADLVVPQLPWEIERVLDSVVEQPEIRASRDVRVCAGGDVMLGNNLDSAWSQRAAARLGRSVEPLPDPDELLAPLRLLVADADVVLLNIEGAIGEGSAPSKCRLGSRTCYAFRQPVETAAALRRLGDSADVVGNVANNHAMDAGRTGFEATLRHLGLAGVYATGADTLPTVVQTRGGDSVAFLGFSTAQAGPDPRDVAAVRRHVARAAERYPRLIVTMHMGAEGTDAQRTRDERERYLGEDRGNSVAFAHAAIEAGASAVIGHGPHVMRAAEWYRGRLVLYSLGNLLTYGPFSLVEPLNRGGVACVSLNALGGVTSARLRSTWQRPPGVVRADPTGRAAFLVDSLSRLDFPDAYPAVFGEAVLRPPDSAKRPELRWEDRVR
jgi:hypothetical protein